MTPSIENTSQTREPVQRANPIEIIETFLSDNYDFLYNENTHRLLYKKKADPEENLDYLTDNNFNSILKRIKLENITCSRDTLRTILYSNYVESFNPYVFYLEGLSEWDGTDYVALLAKTVTTTEPEYWELCLRKWMVAMVASIYDDNAVNQTAIIFSGAQGIGKTRWLRSIIPSGLQEFIFEGFVQTKDKETMVKISECILILMDELENLSGKNIDALKQLMSQEFIYLRRAYTTMSQSYKRRASFAGTVNSQQFLPDLTGNRRFLCFEAQSINVNHNIPLDQLYAQLLYLFRSGFTYWFNEREIAMVDEKNQRFRSISVEEETLTKYFEVCSTETATHFLSTTAIQQLLVQKSGFSNLSINNLGHVLRGLKFPRVKRQDVYVYALKEKIQ